MTDAIQQPSSLGVMETPERKSSAGIVLRLREAANGHPYAKIAWPHYVLHDAAHRIEQLERELAAARRDAERRLRLLQLHHADAMELWAALNNLSFECDNVFATRDGKAGAPSMETYNSTFAVMDKHRATYSEHARENAAQGNTTIDEARGK